MANVKGFAINDDIIEIPSGESSDVDGKGRKIITNEGEGTLAEGLSSDFNQYDIVTINNEKYIKLAPAYNKVIFTNEGWPSTDMLYNRYFPKHIIDIKFYLTCDGNNSNGVYFCTDGSCLVMMDIGTIAFFIKCPRNYDSYSAGNTYKKNINIKIVFKYAANSKDDFFYWQSNEPK